VYYRGNDKDVLTRDKLRQELSYCKETGAFTWIHSGRKAGATMSRYIAIQIFCKRYKAHQLAFLYVTGSIPREIDHINRNSTDNRWCNLRAVSHVENCCNRGIRSDNKSGVTGVQRRKENGRWRAIITVNKKRINLGTFKAKKNAVDARLKAQRDALIFTENHGEK